MAASVSSAEVPGTAATVSPVAGFRTVIADMQKRLLVRWKRTYIRSKPRRSSQSVTAASKAASSTRAPLA